MTGNTALIARIVLRYGASALAAVGVFAPDVAAQVSGDPDILILVGAGLGLVAETATVAARRLGWKT